MQVHHTVSEVEVLLEKFSGLQAQVKELKSSPLCPLNTSTDLAEAVSKMRISAKESISKKKQDVCQLDQELGSLQATSKSCQESWMTKISSAKAQIEDAMVALSLKEDRLTKVNSDLNLKTKKMDKLSEDLLSMKEQLVLLNKALADNKKSNAEKVSEKRRNIKARKEEVDNLEASNKRKGDNLERRRKEADEKKRLSAKLTKQLDQRRQEVKEKEEAVRGLKDELRQALDQVKELKVKASVKGKLDRDLEMLREDLKACNDKKRILEKELKNFSKVKQLKDASDQEKSNLEGRLKLLMDKDESYLEDLNLWKDRLQESEETGGVLLAQVREVKVKIEGNTDELHKVQSSLTEENQTNAKLTSTLAELGKKVEDVNLRKRNLSLEEESVHSETALVQQEKSNLCSRSESLADFIHKLEEEKVALTEELNKVVNNEDKLKKKIEKIECSQISLSESFKKLSNDVEEKEKREQEIASKLAEKKESKKKLADEVKNLKIATSLGEEKLKALLQKEEELTEEMGTLKKKKEKDERVMKSLDKPIKELAESEKSIESLENEIKRIKEEYNRVRSEEEALSERIESLNNEMVGMKEEDSAASLALTTAEEEVNHLRKSIALKEGELSSMKEADIQEDKAVEEMEHKRLAVEAEILQLQNLTKEEGEKYRTTLDQKSKAHTERCKPLEENRTAILKRIAEIEESVKKVDVKVKTQKAKRNKVGTSVNEKSKKSKLNAKKVSEDLADVESQILNVERKIEEQNRQNSALQNEVERLHYVNQIFDDKSDDDEVKPRKFSSVSSSANAKRKLTNSKPDLDVFDMDCSSGDSQPSQNRPPTTPVRNSKLLPSILSSSTNNSINKRPTLASMLESGKAPSEKPRRLNNMGDLPTPPKKALLDRNQSSQKKGNERRKQNTQENKSNVDLDFFELTSQSQ